MRKAYAPGVQSIFAVAADGKNGAGGERIYAAGGLDRHVNSFVRKSFLENVPADSRDTQVQNVRNSVCGRIDADFRIAAEFFLQNLSQLLDAGKSFFEMLHGKRQCRFEGCVQRECRGAAAVNGGACSAVNERFHGDSAFFVQKPAARKPVELVRADACRVCQIQVYRRFADGLRCIHVKAAARELADNFADGFQRLYRPEFAIDRVHRHEHRVFAEQALQVFQVDFPVGADFCHLDFVARFLQGRERGAYRRMFQRVRDDVLAHMALGLDDAADGGIVAFAGARGVNDFVGVYAQKFRDGIGHLGEKCFCCMPCFVIRIGVADKPAFNFAESLQGFFACRGICRVVEVGHNYQKDRKMRERL